MFLTKKQIIASLLAMVLSSPLWADSSEGVAENPNCTKSGKPIIPRQFFLDLGNDLATEEKLGLKPWGEELDDVEWETMLKGGDKEIHSAGPSFMRRPDFQDRLKQWRLLHGLPATVDCSAEPLSKSRASRCKHHHSSATFNSQQYLS